MLPLASVLPALIASKPDGAFVMLGVNAGWTHELTEALHPMSKLLIIAEAAQQLEPLADLPARDIRTALHCQDFDSFIADVAHQRFVGLLLAQPLTADQLQAITACLLPGGLLIAQAPCQPPTSGERWYELPQPPNGSDAASALVIHVKGPKLRRRGAVKRAVKQRA